MALVRPGSPASVRRAVDAVASAAPTYREAGATLHGEMPAGYHLHRSEVIVGVGRASFSRAAAGLQSWQAHRFPGLRVLPLDTRITPGADVLVALGTDICAVAAPCRIIEVLEEESRWGFAYGTLPGHPEQGEEAFLVSMSTTGEVHFAITSFSRPSGSLARVAGPLGRLVQRQITRAYLHALRSHVAR
jgi:uncharacterized protein (UPF0548 family)